ncbi:hypothetical protein [Occultella kanbiaonis]|uniref:hypothetical protein n=1 Tax=Occultella kanbiaonis TaxID=2675754 RepID=UPI001A996C6B|nr:hypothetical protein [Occultella kanbiaonis]
MGSDDDQDCVEHVWVAQGVTLGLDGSHTDHACARCGAVMVVGPDWVRTVKPLQR